MDHRPATDDPEVYSSIPWDRIGDFDRRDTSRTVLMGIAGIVVGLVAAFVVQGGDEAVEVPSLVNSTPVTGSPLLASPAPVSETPTSTTAPAPTVLAEADLMAIDTFELTRAAATAAEWFVTHLFSTGPGASAASNAAALGYTVTDQAGDNPTSSYVEWARVFEVEELPGWRYRTLVLFRTLSGTASDGFSRSSDRAAEVVIDMSSGSARVVDLPRPAGVPILTAAPPSGTTSDAPGVVIERVRAAASRTGRVVGEPTSMAIGPLWRVQLSIESDDGLVWPSAWWADPTGRVVAAGG